MSERARQFAWTEPRVQAAALVAADDLFDGEIAQQLGIDPKTLYRWRQHPVFQARVAEHVAAAEKQALEHGIAQRPKRVAYLDEIWKKGRRLIAARAVEHADVPGGETGLLVRQVKLSATGREVVEFVVDTGLLKELRETNKQAAQELGQWVEKQDQQLTVAEEFLQALKEFGRGPNAHP